MTVDEAVHIVQVSYPRVYFACHTRHQGKSSTRHRLSARDSSILAHLDQEVPITQLQLGAHLGRARSTLSEALARLVKLGYVHRSRSGGRHGSATSGAGERLRAG